ncbi:hypothetical protein [Novosphingobium sp.]|uniref:hypothetical protein n=1 Tax=Novosphingobium sp. TaxID=1874826 RepID=UPI002FDEB928
MLIRMPPCLRRTIIAAVTFAGAGISGLAGLAHAAPNSWSTHAAGACNVIVNSGNLYGFENPVAVTKVTWSGGCTGGQADGSGVMIVYFRQDNAQIYADYHCTFVRGLMQGPWRQASFEKMPGYTGKTGPGDPAYIGSAIYTNLELADGCVLRFEGEPVPAGCNRVTGRQMAQSALQAAPRPSITPQTQGSRRVPQGEGSRVSQ